MDIDRREYVPCPNCEGSGKRQIGVRGPNDPDTHEVDCSTCEGEGWVPAEEEEEEDDDD